MVNKFWKNQNTHLCNIFCSTKNNYTLTDYIRSYIIRDFPGGQVVTNPLLNAGDTSSITGQGTKIPHALGQLNSHATTKRITCDTTKLPHAATKTRGRQININKKEVI